MTVIQIERISSVNSEDPTHPAENLLKVDNKRSWKCKVGEKQALVILQLKQDTVIDGIDIGNENSAFVEVLVGKSSSPNIDFKVLLVASSLMTLKEAKDGTNTNGVRFFKKSDFTKPTADEKWDRVKIVCTQPFNKHVQFGLSFVVLHSSSSQGDGAEASTTLGRFTLKDKDEEEPVAVGSWFAKRKDPPPSIPPGAAASIRDASSPAGIAQGKNKKPTPRRPKNTAPKNGVLKPAKDDNSKLLPKTDQPKVQKLTPKLDTSLQDDEDSPADDTDADSTYSPNKDSQSVLSDDDVIPDESDEEDEKREKRPKRKKRENAVKNGLTHGKTPKRKLDDSSSSKAKVAKVDQETKPFGRLLEGVTIVISGYQNPLRGDLRAKACAMGAKYKADWDSSCTHLICAFVNTPKFNQVRGRGKIVKKEWLEECHDHRKRLPWRRFALDRNDVGTSSEEEIWEEKSIPTTSNASTTIQSGVNRRKVSCSSGSGSDTEEEIERVRARQTGNTPVTQPLTKEKEDVPKKLNKVTPKKTPEKLDLVSKRILEKSDPFLDDTDVDSDSESPTRKLPLPALPDFFENIVFHIACDIEDDERRKLQRYITAYKGSVEDMESGSVEYVITKLPDIAAQLAEEYGVTGVAPDWIWECSDALKLLPVADFTL